MEYISSIYSLFVLLVGFCHTYPWTREHTIVQDRPGETALVAATTHNHLGSAALLLHAKADPNRLDVKVRERV